ncbi:MAG: energy-coupling factor ABC transporter ATP-binding protein [Fusobacteriaceae bacterium]
MAKQIEIKNLYFSYNSDKIALDNISLEVEQGDFIGVIGKSGSGKSTLLRHLNGILKSDKGEIKILGQILNTKSKNLKSLRKKVGVVFQFPDEQLFAETVREDILFAPKNFEIEENIINSELKKIQSIFKITNEMLEENPTELSGGEKRRVAIASVAIYSPEILILDEPTIGLDFENRERLLHSLKKLNENGVTIIVVSHDLDAIWEYTKRIIYMDKGKIMFDGNKKDFINFETESKFVPTYIEFMQKNNFCSECAIFSKDEAMKIILSEFVRWKNVSSAK